MAAMSMDSRYVKLLLFILLSIGLLSYLSQPKEPELYKVLRLSVQPVQNKEQLKQSYRPLMEYLQHELNLDIKWIDVTDYQHQLDQIHNNEIDLVLLGGFAFVKAFEQYGVDPLVMRDIDFRYSSYFLVSKNNPATNISELKNQTLGFGNQMSTSGHIMPRFFLFTQNIIPETFFSQVTYSNGHDAIAFLVQEGVMDVAVVDSLVADKLFKEKQLSKNKVKVLWKSPAFPNYVWAAKKGLPEEIKVKIIEAFIKLSVDTPKHRYILQQVNAKNYFPANSDDFEPIRKIAIQLNMLNR